MLRSDDLACFARVAAAGGFGRAASELGLDVGDVRRRVAELEAALGVPLFVHDVDDLRLTDAGRALAASLATPSVREQRAAVARSETKARRSRRERPEPPPVPGTAMVVRVAATPLLAATVLSDLVVAYVADHPDARMVFGVDLLDPEVTLAQAWRAGPAPTGSLAPTRLRLVASPLWIAGHGALRGADDVMAAPALVWPLGHGAARWPIVRDGRVEEVPLRPRLRSTDLATVRAAALHGLGPTLLPDAAIADDLAVGRLVPMWDDGVGQLGELVVSHPRSGLSDAASAFVQLALERLGA